MVFQTNVLQCHSGFIKGLVGLYHIQRAETLGDLGIVLHLIDKFCDRYLQCHFCSFCQNKQTDYPPDM